MADQHLPLGDENEDCFFHGRKKNCIVGKGIMVDNKLLSYFDQFTVPFSALAAHSATEKVLVLTFKGTKPKSPQCPDCKL